MNFDLLNPYKFTALKTLNKLMGDDAYNPYHEFLSRITHQLVTEEDYKKFVGLCMKVYELGYLKSVKDHKELLNKYGIQVNVEYKQR